MLNPKTKTDDCDEHIWRGAINGDHIIEGELLTLNYLISGLCKKIHFQAGT